MEPARSSRSDDRLDDLKRSVDDGFEEVNARFDRVDSRFEGVEGRIDRIDGRIDKLQQTMIVAVTAMCSTMLAGFGAMFTLFATHF